ncbi:RNA polymerase sigma factor [Paenibacillus pinihumi]|uniref:RNA polymerase sigma factor n=1 Tax=Paenibacillus pinihumi TaxID=669462 RepID=UPI000421A466|nr:sigma-70 family RNA polymerase sigma factor [Paenibacillus pinihumi]
MEQEQWNTFLRSNFSQMDSNSQQLLFHSYRNLIYRDIYFLFRNHELAEDIVQESFLKVVAKAPKLTNTTNMKAWIKKVARNIAYDYFKKNKKYYPISEHNAAIELTAVSQAQMLADQVEDQIRNEVLHQALNELSPNYRQAILLFYIEEKSYKEIAQELNTTEQALAQILMRARKKLYHYFSKKWVDRNE